MDGLTKMEIIHHRFSSRGLGLMLADSFNRLIWGRPEKYPFTQRTDTIVVSGDFSGHHRKNGYQAYSFLIMDLERNQHWVSAQSVFRASNLHDRRRMSFKNLNDKKRLGALPEFLRMANSIDGWLVTFCLTRNVKSIFRSDDYDEFPTELKGVWKSQVVEEALRILHFSSFILTGLSRINQDLILIFDQDAIASNQYQLSKLTTAFGNVWSNYAEHKLRNIRCGTTQNDDGTLALEDLVAIADIAAGAVCEVASEMKASNRSPKLNLLTPFPARLSEKSRYIAAWLAVSDCPLQRVTCFIDAAGEPQKMTAKLVRWHAVRHGIDHVVASSS